MRFRWTLFAVLAVLFYSPVGQASPIKNIKICGDDALWPPFLYTAPDGGRNTRQLKGFALDVIDEIFKRNDIRFTITLLPWSRCQKYVREGEYHLYLNGSWNPTRAREFRLSTGYYQMNYRYYYAKVHHPDGLKIPSLTYIAENLSQCSIRGSANSAFKQLPEGVIKNVADNWDTLHKLLLTRPQMCDFAAVPDAVAIGYTLMGRPYFSDGSMAWGLYPEVEPRTYHMAVSRQYRHGVRLHALIEKSLPELVKDGTYTKLLKRYQLPDEVVPPHWR